VWVCVVSMPGYVCIGGFVMCGVCVVWVCVGVGVGMCCCMSGYVCIGGFVMCECVYVWG
jgi:hypothetical protein